MSLIDILKSKFSTETISIIATNLGESECNVSKAVAIIIPVVLGHLANNSKNKVILDAILNNNENDFSLNLENPSSENSFANSINSILPSLQCNKILNLVSESSGVSIHAAQSILILVIESTLSSLKITSKNQNLENAEGFSKIIDDQKALIPSILPANISLSDIDLNDLINDKNENTLSNFHLPQEIIKIENEKEVSEIISPSKKEEKSFWNWLLPLILLGILSWYFWKVFEKQNQKEEIKIEKQK